MSKLKLMTIVGTRPEIIKMSAIIKKCDKYLSETYTDDYIKNKDDKPSFILEFFSFFVPLFGLIMYLSLNNSKPNRACLCGKFALFGFIVNILIFVITFIGIVIHVGSIPGVNV